MIKVKILNGDAYWMAHYADSDGNVWLDTDEGFSILISKEIEQLTNISKINVEAILGTSLIVTPKNEALIGKPTKHSVALNQYNDFTVQIMSDMKIFNQSELRINGKKEGKTNTYEIEILDSTKHWANIFSEMYLNELPFNKFEYSEDNLWDNFNLGNHYDPGDDGYYFPLVNYGSFSNNEYLTPSDFRPWVHVAKVFELAFIKAGWAYSCPLLDTDTGRKLITYVLKDTHNEDAKLLDAKKFVASFLDIHINSIGRAIQYTVPKNWSIYTIKFPLISGFDYDEVSGKYSGIIRATFVAELLMKIEVGGKAFSGTTKVVVQIVKEEVNGNIIEYTGNAEREWHDKNIKFDYELITLEKDLDVLPGEKVYIRIKMGGQSSGVVSIIPTSTFYNKPISYLPQVGELYDVQKQLREDKVIDYLKGIAHLFNFKFYTSFAEQKVYILTPYDISFFGDSITGFYQNTLEDFTNYIDLAEVETTTPREEKKNIYFRFKDSSDPSISDLLLGEKEALYGNFIDNGFDFKDHTEDQVNPYFEPTLSQANPQRFYLDMPYLLDNKDGKQSTKIGPRIAIAYGMGDLKHNIRINFFNNIQTFARPYAYQLATYLDASYITPTNYLVYGRKEFDLYNMFYKKYNNEFRNCLTSKLKAYINPDKYESITFRNKYLVNINGNSQYGRLLSVGNYNPDIESGIVVFKSDNTSDPTCTTYSPINQCENFPEILITPLGGGNYSITAIGTNASGVTSTVIEWRYFDTPTWTTGSTFSTTSKKVYCRITWDYSDDCQTLQRTGSVDPCGNYPKLCAERTFPEPYTLNVYECGTHSETPTGYLYEFSTNNIAWNIIPDPFLLSDLLETTYLRVTVYYANCPPKTAELTYVNLSSYDDCTYDGLFVPSVAFVTTPAGLTIERKGFFTGSFANDIVWFRKVGSDEEWDLYDNQNREILSTENGVNWEAYRVVMFCNEDCPIYCSSVVTANNDCAGSAEIIDSSQLALYEVMWENPDTAANTWKSEIEDDSDTFVPVIRAFLDEDLGGSHTEVNSRTVEWNAWNFKTEFLWTWAQTDSVKLFKISRNVAGVQTLGLNVDINVQFQTGATNDELKTLLENAIYSAMFNTYSAVDGVDYDVIVTITGSGSTRNAGVAFVSKNVVASTWFGPNATSDYLQTITTGMTTTNHASSKKEFQRVITPAPIATFHSPCGSDLKVRFKVSLATQFVNDASSNFDTIVMNGTITIVDEVVTAVSDSCQKHSLSLTLTGITTPTYTWKKGRKILGTDATVITYGNNQIRCIVGDSDGCYYMAEVNQ